MASPLRDSTSRAFDPSSFSSPVKRALSGEPRGKPTPDYKAKASITPLVKKSLSSVHAGRVKARHIKMLDTSPEPKFGDLVPYNGLDPFTARAISYRQEHSDISEGRNISVLFYAETESEPEGYVIAVTRGRQGEFPHAEMIAMDKRPDLAPIQIIYTERKPCGSGCGHRNCAAKIAAFAPDAKVIYSFKDDAAAREGIRAALDTSPVSSRPASPISSPDVSAASGPALKRPRVDSLLS
jgi:hypothetical protein